MRLCLDRLAGYVAPGVLRQATRLPDCTLVYDDVATMRLLHCTMCGWPLMKIEVDAWSDGTLVVTVVRCPRCARTIRSGGRSMR
jgi:hypothetical protein